MRIRLECMGLETGDLGVQWSLRDLQPTPTAQQGARLLPTSLSPGSVFQKVFTGHILLRPQENTGHTHLCTAFHSFNLTLSGAYGPHISFEKQSMASDRLTETSGTQHSPILF